MSTESPADRVDDVLLERICKAARKVDDGAAARPISSFVYAQPFEPSAFKLIEVSKDVADSILGGEKLYVSGGRNDSLVFCSCNQTFQAKEVERSNSMLITNLTSPPTNCEAQEFRKLEVFSILNRNFELTEGPLCKPPKFRELLNGRLLNPFDEEPEFPAGSLSIQQFMSAMPLCEGHVKKLLRENPIFEIGESMFCLSADGREELMREFAGFLDDRGSADEAVRRSDLENSAIFSEVATRFSSTVVSSLIDWMLAAFFNTEDDGESFRLNVERTGREFCSHVLRRRAWGTFMDLEEVERHFYRLVPAFMRFDQKFLRGIAVYKKKTRSSVQFVCSDNLPLDAKQRLDELWKHADSWALEDIQPYILDFVGDPALVFEFLAARCRVSNVDGQPHFFRL